MIKVGINGYGTIGKRVADAVSKQDDMKVVGVTKTKPSWEAKMAIEKGFDLYAAIPENAGKFDEAGIKISGTINDLLKKVDIVVDCTPSKFGAQNKETYYLPHKIKAIFQGGEKADVADVSFNALANYEKAVGKDYVRVVSCNTTGLSRTLHTISSNLKIGKVRAVLIRRAADPGDSKKGPINAIVPSVKVPSHHGPDVQTVLPDIDIVTSAVKVPTTIMHLHSIMVELKENTTAEDVIKLFEKTPRIKLINSSDGFPSTAEIIEYARDFGRPRYDLYENIIWRDSISIKDNELYLIQAIHQEADVVPENVDAIRAMFNLASKEESIKKTNKSLRI